MEVSGSICFIYLFFFFGGGGVGGGTKEKISRFQMSRGWHL